MAPSRSFGLLDFLLFLAVILAAGGVRAGYLMTCADSGRSSGPFVVQDPQPLQPDEKTTEVMALAHSVQEDNSFKSVAPLSAGVEETAHVSPGYPWVLGLLARAIPAESFEFAVRWGQCALGALTAGIYFLFARRAFRSLAAGTLAGLLCAIHPHWVVNTAAINDGVLISFALGLTLFVGARANQTSGPFASLLFGVLLAGLALVRATMLPFAFFALAWFLLRSRRLSSGWLCALLAFLGFITGLAPWSIRNWQLFHSPVPIVNSTWIHIWMGNNPLAGGEPIKPEDVLPPERQGALRVEKDQHIRYDALSDEVLSEVRENPPALPQRRLQAGLSFFFGRGQLPESSTASAGPLLTGGFVESPGNEPEWLAGRAPSIFLWTTLLLLLLGAIGWRWSYGWRLESMPAAIAVLLIPAPYILSHAESLVGPRLPLDGVLICYAAFTLLCFVPGISGHLLRGSKATTPDETA